jgi:hypothetical protein
MDIIAKQIRIVTVTNDLQLPLIMNTNINFIWLIIHIMK